MTFMIARNIPSQEELNPKDRQHVHTPRVDDVILNDNPSPPALKHVPAEREAMIILALAPTTHYNIKFAVPPSTLI